MIDLIIKIRLSHISTVFILTYKRYTDTVNVNSTSTNIYRFGTNV